VSDSFLFGVFPYVAVAVAIGGLAWRYRALRSTIGARSSQLLEGRALFWGSVPWHLAILAVLAAHALAAVAPMAFARLLGSPVRLWIVEITGLALGALAVAGIAILVVRRLGLARGATAPMDWAVLALLLVQAASGLFIAFAMRWGSVWYLYTAAPWLASLGRLSPDVERMAVLPFIVKLHAVNAFVLVALVPLSRLVHVTRIPLAYLWRPPQLVVWRQATAFAGAGALALGGGAAPDLRPAEAPAPAPARRPGRVLVRWNPEDKAFWAAEGRAIARRNLWISVFALFLAFAVWMVWSVVAVKLPSVGFRFTTNQLFWLAALPGLSGATLRIFYAFAVPIFGGRRWTALSTASLLVPALGIGFAVRDPTTSYGTFLALALLTGLGGANFASSMSNMSFFFPRAEKGTALGLNAGLGNLGVSGVQLAVPLVIAGGVLGGFAGAPQRTASGAEVWLQNAAFVWVPLIVAAALLAWFGMNDIASAKASFKDQAVIFRRKHNWIACVLYLGTFGSFIGFSAGLALLTKSAFPDVDPTRYAFVGPLLGGLARPVGGWLADRLGGARVTLWTFVAMGLAGLGVELFLPQHGSGGSFAGFLLMFVVLFAATGIGNGSVYRMIPVIFSTFHQRRAGAGDLAQAQAQKDALKEASAVVGFVSAIAAYGAFFVPRTFGVSMELTGQAIWALYAFLAYYAICVAVTWWFYARKGAEVSC
jgi:NNP family nitrate/nitrite transporter-like MFS transporter